MHFITWCRCRSVPLGCRGPSWCTIGQAADASKAQGPSAQAVHCRWNTRMPSSQKSDVSTPWGGLIEGQASSFFKKRKWGDAVNTPLGKIQAPLLACQGCLSQTRMDDSFFPFVPVKVCVDQLRLLSINETAVFIFVNFVYFRAPMSGKGGDGHLFLNLT